MRHLAIRSAMVGAAGPGGTAALALAVGEWMWTSRPRMVWNGWLDMLRQGNDVVRRYDRGKEETSTEIMEKVVKTQNIVVEDQRKKRREENEERRTAAEGEVLETE